MFFDVEMTHECPSPVTTVVFFRNLFIVVFTSWGLSRLFYFFSWLISGIFAIIISFSRCYPFCPGVKKSFLFEPVTIILSESQDQSCSSYESRKPETKGSSAPTMKDSVLVATDLNSVSNSGLTGLCNSSFSKRRNNVALISGSPIRFFTGVFRQNDLCHS